jgi:hypothetical protein
LDASSTVLPHPWQISVLSFNIYFLGMQYFVFSTSFFFWIELADFTLWWNSYNCNCIQLWYWSLAPEAMLMFCPSN